MAEGISKKLEFLREIDKLKQVKRATYTHEGRKETDAEHSWHLAMFLLAFEEEFPEADKAKMYKLCLTHDLPEVYAGDAHAFKPEERIGKEEREREAAEQLYGMLPDGKRKEMMALQQEYEEGQTTEAKIVRALDKLQPILQNLLSDGKAWKDVGLSFDTMDENKQPHIRAHPTFEEIYAQLVKEIKERRLL